MPRSSASSKGKGKGKGKGKELEVKTILAKFRPESIGKDDHVRFNVRELDRNIVYNFINFIGDMRHCVSVDKLDGELFNSKFRLGSREEYDNPFVIVDIQFDQSLDVQFLIYKPKLYGVAVRGNGKWKKVSDFEDITGCSFEEADQLNYNSRYSITGPPTRFSFHQFESAIRSLFEHQDRLSFLMFCVIICETTRSHHITRCISSCLGFQRDGTRKVIDLNKNDVTIIENWRDSSGLWWVYDMGCIWDPLKSYPNVGVENADECADVLAVLLKMDDEFSFYIDNLGKKTRAEIKALQRRPINLHPFVGDHEWHTIT